MKLDDQTGRRAAGGHSDPTADTATDSGRLYLREVLTRCDPHLSNAVATLGGIRRGLEAALDSWQGEPLAPVTDD